MKMMHFSERNKMKTTKCILSLEEATIRAAIYWQQEHAKESEWARAWLVYCGNDAIATVHQQNAANAYELQTWYRKQLEELQNV